MADILERIVAERKQDLVQLGPGFGFSVPKRRARPVVPFLPEPGAILEIKRASPSKGDIAPQLDPAALSLAYAAAGAKNVSVLTERRFFKGGLEDLEVASFAAPELSFLRKDFLLEDEEIEISFRAGADAVLLIARILDGPRLRRMAAACRSFGMTPFIEVREPEDYGKLYAAAADGPVLSGVNARDLATFSIDPLIPAGALSRLPGRAVYESGIDSPGAAAYARRLGFEGILVGEAAAKDPGRAAEVVAGFRGARPDRVGAFWRRVAERREALALKSGGSRRPLVKICGLARTADALAAAELGADMLGFVFAESPRAADESIVRAARLALGSPTSGAGLKTAPLFVGVVTELDSPRGRAALSLANEGVLDAIQWHGDGGPRDLAALDEVLDGIVGRYVAVRIGNAQDIAAAESFCRFGEPRVLADARVEGAAGGTGTAIAADLAGSLAAAGGLWLAGGLGVGTVGPALRAYSPELVDASSRLEAEKGKKDHGLMAAYFKEIDDYAR